MDRSVLLIAFYNKKALGVRYLERSLIRAGFKVYVLFLKDFNSKRPEPVSHAELLLLKGLVDRIRPGLIGLSVMSSLYLESVIAVNEYLRSEYDIPIIWGGVYASMFPEDCLDHADFVLRGECEEAIVELSAAVFERKYYRNIKNLAYKEPLRGKNGKKVVNGLRPLCEDLDTLGHPIFSHDNKFYIEGNSIGFGDPMTGSASYELSCSRGCPFMCSYCCSINLKRMYTGNGRYLRFRSVASVISELEEALSSMKSLKVIHFWDEIFPDDKAWIEAFTSQYKARIGLPFEIWAHPLKISNDSISKLVDAGLYKVVMGIQSGSPRIRSEVFHRRETQDDILEAAKVLSKNHVPQVVYDFILRHPFESQDDIRQTYELCIRLDKPFELQLHGLSIFPGTDIASRAANASLSVMASSSHAQINSIKDAYRDYWGQKANDKMKDYWYSLIYLSQFSTGRFFSVLSSRKACVPFVIYSTLLISKLFRPAAVIRHYCKKLLLFARAYSVISSVSKEGRQAVQYNEGK